MPGSSAFRRACMAAAERMTASPLACALAAMMCCTAGPKDAAHSMYCGSLSTCTQRQNFQT
jgi:hypothetical protein